MIDTSAINEIATTDPLREMINEATDEQHIDLTPEARVTDREAAELIKVISGVEHLSDFLKLQLEKQERDLKLLYLKGCSIRQIVRTTGLTKARVERMLS